MAYETLGCKVNQYETEAMRELMEQAGYETVDFSEKADIFLINTCTVTAIADKKSRQAISRARHQNSNAHIFVCGCMAQRDAERVLTIEGVCAVIGSKNKSKIVQIVERSLEGEEKINAVQEILQEREFEPLHISKSGERTRANLKICDGCEKLLQLLHHSICQRPGAFAAFTGDMRGSETAGQAGCTGDCAYGHSSCLLWKGAGLQPGGCDRALG